MYLSICISIIYSIFTMQQFLNFKTMKTEDFEPARETGCIPAAFGLVLLVLIIIML